MGAHSRKSYVGHSYLGLRSMGQISLQQLRSALVLG